MFLTVFELDRESVFRCVKPVLCTSVYFAVHLYHPNLFCLLRYTPVCQIFVSAKPALCTLAIHLYCPCCSGQCLCRPNQIFVQICTLRVFFNSGVFSPFLLSNTPAMSFLLSTPHNRGLTGGRRRMRRMD